MRSEKQSISSEYIARLNNSPFFIVTDYQGLKVSHFTEIRRRLRRTGAEFHVVKNSIFRVAAKEAGVPDLGGVLGGQLAVVTGQRDISVSAKALKTFFSEFARPKIKFGYLKNQRLEALDILTLADLPSLEVLRSRLMAVLLAPASRLAQILNTPASQLARVLRAKADKS